MSCWLGKHWIRRFMMPWLTIWWSSIGSRSSRRVGAKGRVSMASKRTLVVSSCRIRLNGLSVLTGAISSPMRSTLSRFDSAQGLLSFWGSIRRLFLSRRPKSEWYYQSSVSMGLAWMTQCRNNPQEWSNQNCLSTLQYTLPLVSATTRLSILARSNWWGLYTLCPTRFFQCCHWSLIVSVRTHFFRRILQFRFCPRFIGWLGGGFSFSNVKGCSWSLFIRSIIWPIARRIPYNTVVGCQLPLPMQRLYSVRNASYCGYRDRWLSSHHLVYSCQLGLMIENT